MLVRRQAPRAPLASTFVSVLEPYETNAKLATIRRLPLHDARGTSRADAEVGIEIRLGDGRRDVFLSRNVEAAAGAGDTLLVEKETGVRFDGDLCLIRFGASGMPERVLFCSGRSLQIGVLHVRVQNDRASFEIDLASPAAPIVSGPAGDVELVELGKRRLWPK